MKTDEILKRLKGVSTTTNGWQARCPAHDDRKPSLAIGEDDGKTLLHCHAGCATTDIVRKIGLEMRDLFPSAPQQRTPVAKYNYKDEAGELLYQILRYSPKNFEVRRPNGNGGWIHSLDGTRLVPYRLPIILKSDWALITEGEKDATIGHLKLGLPATTNPFGAGKWRGEFSKYFRGKTVALCPHEDDAGRKHMESVSCSLFRIAKEIRMINLPFGKDLAEFCALGGDGKRFMQLFKKASVVTAEQVESWRQSDASAQTELEDKSLGELMAEPEQIVEWLCDGLLPAAGSSLLSAKAKVGKTTMARSLAAAVARGQKFLGRKTMTGAVLYFVGVEEKAATVRHFCKLGVSEADPVRVISAGGAPRNFPVQLERLIKCHKPKLVVLDGFMRFLGIDDVNDYAKNLKALAPIVTLASRSHVHIQFVGHFGKADRAEVSDQVLGSTVIFGIVDTGLFLRERQHFRTIQSKQRHINHHGNLPETEVRYDPEKERVWLGGSKEQADMDRASDAILKFLKASNTSKTEEQIHEGVQGSTKILRDALRQLVAKKNVDREIATKKKGGRGRNPYVYLPSSARDS